MSVVSSTNSPTNIDSSSNGDRGWFSFPRTRFFDETAPKIAFVLFILINAVLFIRPMELIPRLAGWPIYEGLFFACLALSLPAVLRQLTIRSLIEHPITACILCFLVMVFLSHAVHLRYRNAYESSRDVVKLVLYFLLLVAVLNTPLRLRTFVLFIAIFGCIQLAMAVMQHHKIIDFIAMQPLEEERISHEQGEIILQYRICGVGIFHDPNDLAVLSAMTMALCMYQLTEWKASQDKKRWAWSAFWVLALVLCGHALLLTQSRGGFLALLAGAAVLIVGRFGLLTGIVLAMIVVPAIFKLFPGRQTDSRMIGRTTSQLRMGFWSKGLSLLSAYPFFGVGQGEFRHFVGNVAHNSFLHSFTELGFLGGVFFLGAFYLSLWPIYRLKVEGDDIEHRELRRLRPYLMAAIAAWVAGMLSLSRSYVLPTYTVLGLSAVYLRLAMPGPSRWKFDLRQLLTMAILSALFLVGLYSFIRVFHKGS